MSFFQKSLDIPLAVIGASVLACLTLCMVVFPMSIILAHFLGVEFFTTDFVPIVFLVYEGLLFGIFAYTLWQECGLPELERACHWHLALYPIVPLILFAGYDHNAIPIELLGGVSALCLVGSLFQALKAREKAQLFFVFRTVIVAIGLILFGGLCFVHFQEGIGWFVTRIVLWMMTAVYVLAGFLYREVWYQEFHSENEADPR